MRPRVRVRWMTPFGRWVDATGVPTIVVALAQSPETQVTPGAVYQWLGGRPPRIERAMALVELSKGEINLDDIYRHRELLRKLRGR